MCILLGKDVTMCFPCSWPTGTAPCRIKPQENIVGEEIGFGWEVNQLLGFQDQAGIRPRLGCVIKPMLKLSVSVSC